jgi:hypothetical protein
MEREIGRIVTQRERGEETCKVKIPKETATRNHSF